MISDELLSKEWCDLVFEGRNKAYGAYELRRRAGERYARALLWLSGVLLLCLSVHVGLLLYVYYGVVKDAEADLRKFRAMDKLEKREERELRAVSIGRRPVPHRSPDVVEEAPVIVDGPAVMAEIGLEGPEDIPVSEEFFRTSDADTLHNSMQTELPVEGVQLTPTEVVEEMPLFPGGIRAMMDYLEEHVSYPARMIRNKVEGEVEVTFLVDAEGAIVEPHVTKPLHHDLDEIALAAVRGMPRWTPGKRGGRVALVQVTLPIRFALK